MANVIVCPCGKSLRAELDLSEIRCPVCEEIIYLPKSSDRPEKDNSQAIIFGFDPPAASLPRVQLQYQVVEVSSEVVPPEKRGGRAYDDDENSQPYPLAERKGPRDRLNTQGDMWGPDYDLRQERDGALPPGRRRGRRRPGEWVLERHWHECLAYPVRAWPLVGALGFAFTFATFGLLQVLRDEGPLAWFFAVIGAVTLAYSCGFLSCVLNSGASGDVADVRWPGANLKILLESVLAALLSFLAGPIIPATVGVYFWIYSGDFSFIDYVIFLELIIATIGYWLLVFFSAAVSERWSSLLPGEVMKRARQLGTGRTIGVLAAVTGIFLFHAFFALAGLENHHSMASFILLFFCWTSLLFWMVFLMRWLGISVHRAVQEQKTAEPA